MKILHLTKLIFLLVIFSIFAVGQENKDSTAKKQVLLNIEVVNRDNEPVTDLKAEYFRLYEDKKSLEINYFGNENLPLSVGFLIDASPSMSGAGINKTDLIRKGILTFLEKSNAQNEYFVAAFAKKVDVLSEFADARETAKTISANPYFSSGHGATTALYDAISLGIENLSKAKNQKRILFVCGDGKDTDSVKKYKDIEKLVKEKDVIIYYLGFDNEEFYGGGTSLAKLARLSGGRPYYPYLPPSSGNIANTQIGRRIYFSEEAMLRRFSSLAERLQKHYVVGFKLNSDDKENKWRNLEVKLEIPKELRKKIGLTYLSSRDGYFPSSELVRSN